ncbi:MAG: PKD domain-containing protein, partial [Vibrio sp.]
EDVNLTSNASFSDDQDYSSPQAPDSGRKVMPFGLKIDLLSQSKENEYGVVRLSKATTNIAPVARFELKVEGLTVTSQNTSSDSDGNIVSYLWDFGNHETSTEAAPTWSYAKAGTYQVTLTVTDDKGATDTHHQTIKVEKPNMAPKASASYIHLGRWVTMWSTSTDRDGRIVDTEWTLPNGQVKRGRIFTAIFPSDGKHEVVLKVMDNRGAVDTKTIKVKL